MSDKSGGADASTSLLSKVVAFAVLIVLVLVALKIFAGLVSVIFWIAVAVVVVAAMAWVYRTLAS